MRSMRHCVTWCGHARLPSRINCARGIDLGSFSCAHGRRAPEGTGAWTGKYMKWIKEHVHFEQQAQEATLSDYLHDVEHAGERIQRLENSIDAAIQRVPEKMRAVIQGLQSLRGIYAPGSYARP